MKKIIILSLYIFLNYSFIYTQCNVIYVTPTGSGTGTKASPSGLLNAINVIATTGDHIKLDTGLYIISAPITSIPDSLIIEGGFISANNWNKTSLAGATVIYRDSLNVQDAGLATTRISAFELSNINGFRFQDVTIKTDNAPVASTYGVSTYGIHLNGCSNYNIIRCQILLGNASKGKNGTNGINGSVGANGNNGQQGYDDSKVKVDGGTGGAGGVGISGGSAGQGRTGDGAGYAGGNGSNSTLSYSNGGGGGGGGGGGRTEEDGGYGGYGGGTLGFTGCFSSITATPTRGQFGDGVRGTNPQAANCIAPGSGSISGGHGVDGINGSNGCNGPVGPVGSKSVFWSSGVKANDGVNGQGGQGGAGGGGGAGEGCTFCDNGTGAGGGGGGGGGQGGVAGTGAYGGGSSYGVYIVNNGANGIINDCYLVSGTLGLGGTGGTGGTGGIGGNGGNGGPVVGDHEVGCGGDGGDGGDGGNGGAGGNGAPGEAISIYLNGTGLITQDVGFNLAAQPVIIVDEKFCTGDSVNFSSSAMGLWAFGANSTVSSATGTNVSTTYKQGGRKDINYNGQAYAGFAYITILSPSLAYAGKDSIACTTITLYADSVINGVGNWTPITPGVVVSNPSAHNSAVTLVNGSNLLEWVVSYGTCCLPTRDTVEIIKNTPSVAPTAIISLLDTVCIGDSLTLTVNGGSLGTGGQWIWYSDSCGGTQVGNGVTTKVTVNANTTYFVRAESNCGNTVCVSKLIYINPISIPATSILSSTDTLCRYDSVILTVNGGSLLPGDEWNWYESSCGGIYVGTGTSIIVAPVNNATYFVRGEGASCKPTTCISKIVIVKGAVVSLIPFDTICGVLQSFILNNANPSGGYYSGTGVTNGTFDPVVADYGNHVITYTYTDLSSGCIQAVYDTLVVSSGCADIEKVLVVNTFSPNGDGRNDTWNLNLGNYTKSKVTVFNKWGQIVYVSNERIIQWDGNYQSKPLPSGSYFYIIEIDDQEPYQGSITIVR